MSIHRLDNYIEHIQKLPQPIGGAIRIAALGVMLSVLNACSDAERDYTTKETFSIDFSRFIENGSVAFVAQNGGDSKISACTHIFPQNRKNIELGENNNSIRVKYPAHSSTPSESPDGITGGFGALCNLPDIEGTAFQISYTLDIPKNFVFGKGLKAHGACFIDCPRGGNNSEGVSLRIHTLKDEISTYTYGVLNSHTGGEHHKAEDIFLSPGESYKIRILIDTQDGYIATYINQKLAYTETRTDFSSESDLYKNTPPGDKTWKLMLSTFRGGDQSWSVPLDTELTFSDWQFKSLERK